MVERKEIEMPLVLFKHAYLGAHPRAVADIAQALPSLVAEALTVEEADGQLAPEDIEVWVLPENPGDVNPYHLGIVIFAQEYPSRRAKLDEARAYIIRGLETIVPDAFADYGDLTSKRGFVWVLLGPGSFGEFAI